MSEFRGVTCVREDGVASNQPEATSMARLQELQHGWNHDYERSSPHLRHPELRSRIVNSIRGLTLEQFGRSGRCRVLEVGAGHGSFTDHVAATGAEITVTEMSRPSVEVLRNRFAANDKVRLVYDDDGEAVFRDSARYDLVLCISVLHHIPDYIGFVDRLTDRIDVGGAFASFQDPLWYPRRSRLNLAIERSAYYFWRLRQGDLRRGFAAVWRRMRGIYAETEPSDMVEYHVVRQGVDEDALGSLLFRHFHQVDEWRYWSTQAPTMQSLLARSGIKTTFGLVARGRR